jgi:hypothetical protein
VDDGHIKDHQNNECDIDHQYHEKWAGRQVIKMLADEINSANPTLMAEGMLQEMLVTHRYLQAEIITTLYNLLVRYGDLEEKHQDGRNAGAVRVAKKMSEAL